jgi:ribosomal protein L22
MADEKDIEITEPEATAPEAAETTPAPEADVTPAAEATPEAEAEAKPARAPRARAARADADAEGDDAPAPRARRARARRVAAEAKPAEQPKAESRRRDAAPRPPVVRAQAKYVRSSARKARLVCDHIRGKSVEEARAILAFTPRSVARDWSKVLESAVANAEHNHELDGEDLLVKAAHADEGPTLKRFQPRAMGRATPIRKRTSHLTILLAPKE